MMEWINNNASTIIVGILLLLVVSFIIKKLYRDKKHGNCSGGCSHCGASSVCHSKQTLVQEYYQDK